MPWAELKIDVVLECTGHFLTRESAGHTLKAGCEEGSWSAAEDAGIKTVVPG
ncbi:MAG: hypothetical protein IPH63_12915 [Flavobacteriales bacterium]|nr:hypothetical protein [Flavobacteriales bacterium]